VPRKKIKVGKEKWKAVRIHEVYYNELVEICQYLELPLAQCIGHIVHEAYLQLESEIARAQEEAVKEVAKQAREVAKHTALQQPARRRRPIPPPP
jgi:hypothetical protein